MNRFVKTHAEQVHYVCSYCCKEQERSASGRLTCSKDMNAGGEPKEGRVFEKADHPDQLQAITGQQVSQ